MNALIVLGVIAAVPIVLALVLRVSAVMLFLSAAIGNLMMTHLSDDAELVIGMVVKGGNMPMVTRLVLLFAPVLFTVFFLRKTIPPSQLFLQLLPLVATGLAIAVLALPLLPSGFIDQAFNTSQGSVFKDSQDLIVSTAAFLVLILAWFTHPGKATRAGRPHK